MNRVVPETANPSRDEPSHSGTSLLDGFPPLESCGDFNLRIGHDGTWFYHGSPIGRKAITKLFASVLRRENDGSYWLVTPAERGRIAVDDVPFVAVSLEVRMEMGQQALIFTTNLDEVVTADADHDLWVDPVSDDASPETGGTPYIHIRGGLNARLSRPVYYQLAELAVVEQRQGRAVFGVWSAGRFFVLGEHDGTPMDEQRDEGLR